MEELLQIRDLTIQFKGLDGSLTPGVTEVSFTVNKGETVALVGESGSGKTITALSIMGLLPDAASITQGEIVFEGQDVLQAAERERAELRGARIGMIFQDPMSSLSPFYTVGNQMAEGLRLHLGMNRKQAWEYGTEWLEKVGIENPARVMKAYPGSLSGGMRQRVLIAMVVSLKPSLLIADEPTTALDVTTQAEILNIIRQLQQEHNLSVLFVSHDLGVVSEMCTRTVVMYAGQVVEDGQTKQLFAAPTHPYTRALLAATPRLAARQERFYQIPGQVPLARNWGTGCRFRDRCAHASDKCVQMPDLNSNGISLFRCWHPQSGALPFVQNAEPVDEPVVGGTKAEPVLSVKDLKTYYPIKKGLRTTGIFKAVDGVSFELFEGETLALVGESGSGKTTTGRSILRLVEPTAGKILFEGRDVSQFSNKELHQFRRKAQIVFQDPSYFVNPRLTVGETIAEPMIVHQLYGKADLDKKISELLEAVGLDASFKHRYPHECSGGQKQRIGIARALSLNPKVIIADEPVSALDVSIQAQVLNLFKDLKQQFGLSYIFISHDLSVVRNIADRVAVMYKGKIVETGEPEKLFSSPDHAYTKKLLASIPKLDADVQSDAGGMVHGAR